MIRKSFSLNIHSSIRLVSILLASLLCVFFLAACGASRGGDSGQKDGPPDSQHAPDPARQSSVPSTGTGTAAGQGSAQQTSPPKSGTPVPATPKTAEKPGKKPFTPTPGKEIKLDGEVSACWLPLVEKLQSDNMGDPIYAAYFNGLEDYSSAPMSVKVKELFTNAYLRKRSAAKPSDGDTLTRTSTRARIYKKVVTEKTMQRCIDFLEEHKEAFDAVEKKYAVPREVIAALIYVETRHGDYLGSANAFWSLACMAAATEPETVTDGIAELPIKDEHQEWLQAKLTEKSSWAYKELKALLVYCNANELDPRELPGSVYGAIGLCQFMPSNLIPYGDDGNGDGIVNLFEPADAIFSVAKYLTGHGWKKGVTVEQQRNLLRRYNNLMTYANTILTLAESARTGELQSAPPDIPKEDETKTAAPQTDPAKAAAPEPQSPAAKPAASV